MIFKIFELIYMKVLMLHFTYIGFIRPELLHTQNLIILLVGWQNLNRLILDIIKKNKKIKLD